MPAVIGSLLLVARRCWRDAALAACVCATTFVLAPAAHGSAGGGSSGFGGGGGGSFGGGSGGSGTGEMDWVVFVISLVVVGVLTIAGSWGGWRLSRRRAARRRRVELAALEAAEDDPAFAPEAVARSARVLFRAVQEAWDARDERALRRLLGPELLVEWRRRLADFAARGWHNQVDVVSVDSVEYLGLVNREGIRDDRVTVRICATLIDVVEDARGRTIKRRGADGEQVEIAEHWVLGRRGRAWIRLSIEQDEEGAHVLEQEIVAAPSGDELRLRDASVVEVAVADRLPEGMHTAEVADLDFAGDARAAALDLSLADGRWAPDLLEVAARRAVAAWAEAVDGADRDLLDVASPEAAQALLHPGDRSGKTRLVIRGPRVRHLSIVALDPAGEPPTMTVEVEVSGRRYVEDRDDASVRSGSRERETTSTERWTLALTGPDEHPWRIVGVRG